MKSCKIQISAHLPMEHMQLYGCKMRFMEMFHRTFCRPRNRRSASGTEAVHSDKQLRRTTESTGALFASQYSLTEEYNGEQSQSQPPPLQRQPKMIYSQSYADGLSHHQHNAEVKDTPTSHQCFHFHESCFNRPIAIGNFKRIELTLSPHRPGPLTVDSELHHVFKPNP